MHFWIVNALKTHSVFQNEQQYGDLICAIRLMDKENMHVCLAVDFTTENLSWF